MTLTLLFDMDDTLLGNSMDTFIPEYTKMLAKAFSGFVESDELIECLLASTQQMMSNLNPGLTLEEVFDKNFYPALKIERIQVQEAIDNFYKNEYPNLQRLTQHRSDAVAVIDEAFASGYQVAIATNPLFPKSAIYQRLEWAGLSPTEYPFLIVPSYETFHFAKPNPEFFSELLGQVGWPDGPVVMVGDDVENDIRPAQSLGLATYLIHPDSEPSPGIAMHGQGHISNLLPWLSENSKSFSAPEITNTKAIITHLRANPAVIRSLTTAVSPDHWRRKPATNEWSLTEIVCHLRDVDQDLNIQRLNRILSSHDPFIAGRNTDLWAEERNYTQQDGIEALRMFISSRMELITIIENLTLNEWQLSARHAIFGPIVLQELVNIIISHDRMHLKTIYHLLEGGNGQSNCYL